MTQRDPVELIHSPEIKPSLLNSLAHRSIGEICRHPQVVPLKGTDPRRADPASA